MTEPLPKSWYIMKENKITKDDTTEEIQRKKMYAKLCADKKPYFFAYNYASLKTEYDTFMKTARSNAMSLYKKDLDDMTEMYENGLLADENEIRFIENFKYKLPLDLSKSTMNRICWAVEAEFDNVNLFKDVQFDYSILKSGKEYSKDRFNAVKHLCGAYKPSIQLAKKKIFADSEEEEDWTSVDIILKALSENLYSCCSDEDELCDILVDLCYGQGMSKQILWDTCGDVIIKHLLKDNDYKMTYPQKSDNGEFWCGGSQFQMKEIDVRSDFDD